ncbi:cation-translocating P-type ATPase [Luteolibacter sp. LG18]|uniref:heavy metal translocating P-type ATPase n=1 Tax=Luteolibacter sp. LG18 TaxID=2819286 RepID=UPI002B2D332F|nr:metal-transporting ATPase [Luteolibacter sp. LG18]
MNGTATSAAPDSPAPLPALQPGAIHVRAILVALGLALLGLSRLAGWLQPGQADLHQLWAMAGLALAAVPVLIDSLTSLKADGFEATKYYMDQFVALAILACFATAQYATGTLVAAILIIGQILEERATLGVEEAIQALTRITRTQARRMLASGTEEAIDAALLQAGDTIRLRPGDTVPADAEILLGTTTLDQASITGESLPVDAAPGTRIYAGTTNLTGAIEARVTTTGHDTVLGRVTSIIEEAKSSRAPVMRLIDQYTRYYMPLVLIIAGFVLFFTRDVQRSISVIIVAMPCAFVLASPSAMVAALAVAARMGILVKSSRFFEVAREIDTVVFDKTGTLTTGRLQVTGTHPAEGFTGDDLLALAAALETGSTHPVARAILAEADRRGLPWDRGIEVTEFPGLGVGGGGILAGRRGWLESQGVTIPAGFAPETSASSLHVARDGRHAGCLLLADTLRPESPETVAALRDLGIERLVMLTGDHPAVAAAISSQAGVDHYRASCLPAEKMEEVRALKAAGRKVMVVGDGVNDAPALAAGDLGIAMGALGSDVAIKTSDIALMGNDLRHLAGFIQLSDRTLRIINQNLLWGFVLIVVMIVVSSLGLVSPIAAACLHEFSAFLVIFNSARLLRFDPADNS